MKEKGRGLPIGTDLESVFSGYQSWLRRGLTASLPRKKHRIRLPELSQACHQERPSWIMEEAIIHLSRLVSRALHEHKVVSDVRVDIETICYPTVGRPSDLV